MQKYSLFASVAVIGIIVVFFIVQAMKVPNVSPVSSLYTAERLVPNVVRIEVQLEDDKSENGFGFITNEDNSALYIVTAAHVTHGQYGDEKYISDPERITVFFSSSYEQKNASEIAWFEDEDLALLRVEKPVSFTWSYPFVASSFDTNEKVRFIGRNGRFNVVDGGEIIEQEGAQLVFTPYFILPGTSGAPLINRSGIVGMIIDDSVEEARALNIHKIRELLQMPSGESPYFADSAPF